MAPTGADEGIPRGLLPARSISGSGGPAASTPRPATCGSAQGRGRGDDADEGIPQGLLPVRSTGRSGGPAASPPRSAQGRGQRDGAGEGFQDSDASRVVFPRRNCLSLLCFLRSGLPICLRMGSVRARSSAAGGFAVGVSPFRCLMLLFTLFQVRGGRVGSQVMHGCFGLHLRACAVCQLAR